MSRGKKEPGAVITKICATAGRATPERLESSPPRVRVKSLDPVDNAVKEIQGIQ